MIIDSLKAMKKKYIKADPDRKKYKGEIQTLHKAIKKIEKLEKEIAYYEKKKQGSFFNEIDGT